MGSLPSTGRPSDAAGAARETPTEGAVRDSFQRPRRRRRVWRGPVRLTFRRRIVRWRLTSEGEAAVAALRLTPRAAGAGTHARDAGARRESSAAWRVVAETG
jgi:hypothetical protein